MGASRPFLYGHPSASSFYGPTDRPFNPKAVTQASWTRDKPKPAPKGPLLNVNRSYIPNSKSDFKPMSPKTKGRVKYSWLAQMAFRVLALLGALGSLFCGIVIKNALAAVIWIIRVGPIVGVLHTVYAIFHLSRSPINRAPKSESSYMLFASVFDVGLIPFYVFTAFVSYGQYAADMYHWGVLFGNNETIHQVAQAAFILSVVNAGIHGFSLIVSLFLATIFRQISKLPPDVNPLEDNLTARPLKGNKSDISEKHRSQSTVDSTDPLIIEPPRIVPFTHSRDRSFGTETSLSDERRYSQMNSVNEHRLSHAEPLNVNTFSTQRSTLLMPQTAAQNSHYMPTQPIQTMFPSSITQEEPHDVSDRSLCISPDSSANWVTYQSRSASPVDSAEFENFSCRNTSSAFSRSNTTSSTISGFRNWLASAHNYGRGTIRNNQTANGRGNYASLTAQEYYENDENENVLEQQSTLNDSTEQDLGDHRIDIFPDNNVEDINGQRSLPFNPLAMNPPTPQPPMDGSGSERPVSRRIALSDIPNLSSNQSTMMPPIKSLEKKGRFYGGLENNSILSLPRSVSIEDETNTLKVGKRRPKLAKRTSAKNSTYGSVNQDEDDSASISEDQPVDPATTESDRRGRVVSNSGADVNIIGTGPGMSSSPFPYGNYMAGLGVGRRRDVSGKIAEEGRGLDSDNGDFGSPRSATRSQPTQIRAPGWARFAGL